MAAQGQHMASQGRHLAAQGLHVAAQGLHLAAQGLHMAAQGLHLAAQGLHMGAQGLHMAAQGLQMHHIAVHAVYGCWLAGHKDHRNPGNPPGGWYFSDSWATLLHPVGRIQDPTSSIQDTGIQE